MSKSNKPFVSMEGITKTYAGNVTANDNIDFEVERGEIHGVLGENGAGKSTLMEILYGLQAPDSGSIYFDGEMRDFSSPQDAIAAGIGMVHQHFMLIPRMTVLENVILGSKESRFDSGDGSDNRLADSLLSNKITKGIVDNLTIDRSSPREEIAQICDELDVDISLDDKVRDLSMNERQRVEIIKSLYRDADLLILDEPTAVLSPIEVDSLFDTLTKLVDDGFTIIIITHKLGELQDITDRITVLRGGRVVDTVDTESVNSSDLVQMMVDEKVELDIGKETSTGGEEVLRASDLSAKNERGETVLSDVDITIHESEIVGIAAVSGNGQKELAECLAGVRVPTMGEITFRQQETLEETAEFIDSGISYIPEDRLEHGCAAGLSARDNLIVKDRSEFQSSLGMLQYADAGEYADTLIDKFGVEIPDSDVSASKLSGGNLQKMIIARELARDPVALIACQPTRGVDVNSMNYIRNILIEQSEKQTGVLFVSEDVKEVLEISDRIIVMYDGEIVHRTDARDVEREKISKLMNSGEVGDSETSVEPQSKII